MDEVWRFRPVDELPPEQRQARREELSVLGDEICTLAAQIASAQARFLQLLAEYDAAQGWKEWEMRSCAHWLSWRCAMDLRTAREHVRVARALPELPMTSESFLAGELSFSKVRALSRVATAETEPELVMMARHSTASQLERLCRGLRTAARASTDPVDEELLAGPAQGPPRVTYGARWHVEPETGDLILWGRFSPEEGQVLLAALTRAEAERVRVADAFARTGAEPAPQADAPVEAAGQAQAEHDPDPGSCAEPGTEPSVSPGVEYGEAPTRVLARTGPPGDPGPALVAMAMMTLADLPVPELAPAAEVVFIHQVGVPPVPAHATPHDQHCDAENGSAEHPDTDGSAEHRPDCSPGHTIDQTVTPHTDCTVRGTDGPALAPAVTDLVLCTAHQRDVIADAGAVLTYGRRRRLASPRQVKALRIRDHGACRAPGCGRTGFLHAHHVRHWSHGGPTDLDNLILLCSACHTLVHLDRLRIVALGNQRFEFRHPDSDQVIPPAPPLRGHADQLLYGNSIDPARLAGGWDGTKLDLSAATAGLLEYWRIRRQQAQQPHATPEAA